MRSRHTTRRGVALVLVLSVLAVVAVMGIGLLSSNALQAQVTRSSLQSGTADCLAGSGIDLALYYLQHPAKAPTLNSDGYWPGGSGISLGSGVTGQIDVSVVRDAAKKYLYTITSTGKWGSGSSFPITRKAKSLVEVRTISSAVTLGAAITLPPNVYVKGDVQAAGILIVNGRIDGVASAPWVFAVPGAVWGVVRLPQSLLPYVPANNEARDYSTYKWANGAQYSAQEFPIGRSVVNPDPNSNPAGIFYCNSVSLSDVTINGTLVVYGSLTINGPVTINARDGFPAIVGHGSIKVKTIYGGNAKLVANGVTWLSGSLLSADARGKSGLAQFNGALLLAGGSIDSLIPAVQVYYRPELCRVTDLDTTDKMPKTYKLLSWE